MKNVIDSFISLIYLPSIKWFNLNTNILEINVIKPTMMLGVLIYFIKGVCVIFTFE